MNARLELADGTTFNGEPFGFSASAAGEVVFNTGMVGYPESLTDPSYHGQILILTYPIVGNYGVPRDEAMNGINEFFESSRIHVSALVVSSYSSSFSHWNAETSLDNWLKANRVPAIAGIDTRMVTQKMRQHGSMLGRLIRNDQGVGFYDPNRDNLVSSVSVKEPVHYGEAGKRIVLIDCGCKNGILRALLSRQLQVTVVPWDWPVDREVAHGVVVSNGPGDPKRCEATVETLRKLMTREVPIFAVCLGSQLLALAAGAETYKLKYGHRGQNQPCVQVGTKRCFVTSQNHGYAVREESLPANWLPWFFNANDGTNEGIRHRSKPFYGVQFHPEASPGPKDTEFLFDDFVSLL